MYFQYRVVLNGLGYILFGIPEKDLCKTWTNCNVITTSSGQSPLLNERELMRTEVKYKKNLPVYHIHILRNLKSLKEN